MDRITFITGNQGKAAQLSRILNNFPLEHKKLDLIEIQSLDLKEIVTHKVKEAYRILQTPVLVEDVALTFHALNHLPGPLIKWFLKELGNEGLCELLNAYPSRKATAEVNYALYDGKDLHIFAGQIDGEIAKHPRGDLAFGWSPAFIPDGQPQTLGEMTLQDQDNFSMRKPALAKLEAFLKDK